mmetsp:Transcript_10750/g.44437  ORF Transcript_10750/g.44437 Transcript_10750/m.44437 type:complete len:257 (+) Transcript_10750:3527-4297(+)
MRRCILPVAVRGSSSVMWMTSGTLCAARRSRQCACMAATDVSLSLGRRTTAACTLSPYLMSLPANDAACATAGIANKAESTSSGLIFSPPRLMSSLMRPSSVRNPSWLMDPISPVLNHEPSAAWRCRCVTATLPPALSLVGTGPNQTARVKDSALALLADGPTYPANSVAPWMHTSPDSFAAVVASSPGRRSGGACAKVEAASMRTGLPATAEGPSVSRTPTRTPRRVARPTVPGLRALRGASGFDVIWWHASVIA